MVFLSKHLWESLLIVRLSPGNPFCEVTEGVYLVASALFRAACIVLWSLLGVLPMLAQKWTWQQSVRQSLEPC